MSSSGKKSAAKAAIRTEKDEHRARYRVFKELRLWLAGLLVVCLIITVVVGVMNKRDYDSLTGLGGDNEYERTAALSAGNSEISLMELSYYFYDTLYGMMESETFMRDYGAYGLDPEKPLKDLEYTALRSWFDELMERAVETAKDTIRYKDLADKSGTVLDAEDEKLIDERVDALKTKAEEEGRGFADYLDYRYCPGMSEADLRAILASYRLAEKQYDLSLAEMRDCTEEELTSYYFKNRGSLESLDFITYRFEMKRSDAEDLRKAFEACNSDDEFLSLIREDLPKAGCPEDQIDSALSESQNRAYYSTESPFLSWAFTDGRKAGDKLTREADGYIEVYYVVRPGGVYTFPCADIRALFINSEAYGNDPQKTKEAAEELYAKVLENPTEENFISLVKEHSHDYSTVNYGGEYADVVPGDLAEDFNDWVFAEGRKAGDIGMVESAGSYNIFYYIKSGDPCWMAMARNAIVEERMADFTEELQSSVDIRTSDDAIYNKIPDDLAAVHERRYEVAENGDGADYKASGTVFIGLYCCLGVSVVIAAATIYAFVETRRLKKRYMYTK